MKEFLLIILIFLLHNVGSFFNEGGHTKMIAMNLFNMIVVCLILIGVIFYLIKDKVYRYMEERRVMKALKTE